MPKDYDQEKWVNLYKMAILGLERAKLTGRIEDARCEIAARAEKLRDVPGLHAAEIHAIDNAHRVLRFLEGEEERYAAEEKRRAIEEAPHQLRSIASKIQNLRYFSSRASATPIPPAAACQHRAIHEQVSA
jgi:hypothetical protein